MFKAKTDAKKTVILSSLIRMIIIAIFTHRLTRYLQKMTGRKDSIVKRKTIILLLI